jgi:hypothetical protein
VGLLLPGEGSAARMTIEHSHGKARPTLPRASDLKHKRWPGPGTDPERAQQRDARGRFVAGNTEASGRGAIAPIKRTLGHHVDMTDADARTVARDAHRLYCATLRELPSSGAMVKQLAALWARHTALSAFWSTKASLAGLGSEDGVAAAAEATKHGQRAERLSVTLLDVAKDMAAGDGQSSSDPLAKWRQPKEAG